MMSNLARAMRRSEAAAPVGTRGQVPVQRVIDAKRAGHALVGGDRRTREGGSAAYLELSRMKI